MAAGHYFVDLLHLRKLSDLRVNVFSLLFAESFFYTNDRRWFRSDVATLTIVISAFSSFHRQF